MKVIVLNKRIGRTVVKVRKIAKGLAQLQMTDGQVKIPRRLPCRARPEQSWRKRSLLSFDRDQTRCSAEICWHGILGLFAELVENSVFSSRNVESREGFSGSKRE